eukprot:m51a1_g3660 putative pyridine nucleotide transhydrogenase (1073) ;mRNA; r:230263-234441
MEDDFISSEGPGQSFWDTIKDNVSPLSYVAVSILFILSLGGLSSQRGARVGNLMGILGMALALGGTFAAPNFHGFLTVFVVAAPGAVIGFILAANVVMTAMPQLIACLHSFVGLAAVLVGVGNFLHEGRDAGAYSKQRALLDIETFVGVFIGAVTFTGSVVAFGKLQGFIRSTPLIILGWFRHVLNAACVLGSFAAMGVFMWYHDDYWLRFGLLLGEAGVAFWVGWHLVMAIGGADMPVVVSMLNSYSGWATAASGFMLNNDAMIVTGSLVGSSGAILSSIMCSAMNRSFISVIFGGFGAEAAAAPKKAPAGYGAINDNDNADAKREVSPISAQETVQALLDAKSVVIVPGYGLAVAHGQHAVAEIAQTLRRMGKSVRFAIHPVAGRLPGHMNVLLAEANVPYDIVLEMDEINPELPETDVCVVVGANDIVNPIALTDPASPIAGMPIIETFKSRLVVVNKRSMASGYSGIDNPLFYYDNTRMLFGDAKKAFDDVLAELNRRKGEVDADAASAAAAGRSPSASSAAAKQEKPVTEADLPPPFCVVGVPKEVAPGERMVALPPAAALALRRKGFAVVVEAGAGEAASFPDSEYTRALCEVTADPRRVWQAASVVLKVQAPLLADHPALLGTPEVSLCRAGQTIVSFAYPARSTELVERLTREGVTLLAMDLVPRITRAQKLDALSSLSNLTGYRAVVEASNAFGRVFTGQITAAGKLPPATVLVIGAGVAGLSAIGTAKNLGAIVKGFDTRKSVREQVESMGGEFVPVPIDEDAEDANGYAKPISPAFVEAELGLFRSLAPTMDIIITTAAIPNRRAPLLLLRDMVESMRPGSVVVDLAAATGGNCELTRPGETYRHSNGVTIVGNTDLVAKMAPQASTLYSQNLVNLLDMLVTKDRQLLVDPADEVVRQLVVCHKGALMFPAPKMAVSAAPRAQKRPAAPVPPKAAGGDEKKKPEAGSPYRKLVYVAVLVAMLAGLVFAVPGAFVSHFLLFVLSIFVGYHVIWNVTPALHTPLMSVTNAISGIITVGGMLLLDGVTVWTPTTILGGVATLLAMINICGGFCITHRMLQMFHD